MIWPLKRGVGGGVASNFWSKLKTNIPNGLLMARFPIKSGVKIDFGAQFDFFFFPCLAPKWALPAMFPPPTGGMRVAQPPKLFRRLIASPFPWFVTVHNLGCELSSFSTCFFGKKSYSIVLSHKKELYTKEQKNALAQHVLISAPRLLR